MRCRFSCHLHFKYSVKIMTNDDTQQTYIKLLLKHFMPFWQIEVSLFLSSPFHIIDEYPDKWWFTTIVWKPVVQHFTPFRKIRVSLFLSSPFQVFVEDPDNWYNTKIVYKAVCKTLHTQSTNWGADFPVCSISKNRWRSRQLMIYNKRI